MLTHGGVCVRMCAEKPCTCQQLHAGASLAHALPCQSHYAEVVAGATVELAEGAAGLVGAAGPEASLAAFRCDVVRLRCAAVLPAHSGHVRTAL